MGKNVLLIGRNPTVLANLATALTDEGLAVETTSHIEEVSQNFNGANFDLIAFGRGVDEATNALLRNQFSAQNPKLIFVNGLAPVIPLLVRQINVALFEGQYAKKLTAFVCLKADCSQVQVSLKLACLVTIDLYELDAVHNTRKQTLISESVTAGIHTFSLQMATNSDSNIKFLAAQADNHELIVLPLG